MPKANKSTAVVFLLDPPEALISKVFGASSNAKKFLVFSGSLANAEERLKVYPDLRVGIPVAPRWDGVAAAVRAHKIIQEAGAGNTVFLIHGKPSGVFKKVRLEKVLRNLTKRDAYNMETAGRSTISEAMLGA